MESMDYRKRKRKIEMKRIENPSSRLVAFSKRKKGLIGKAQQLHNLTGADIAVLVFSPAGRPFVHGSPNFEATVDRFLNSCSGTTAPPTACFGSLTGSETSSDHGTTPTTSTCFGEDQLTGSETSSYTLPIGADDGDEAGAMRWMDRIDRTLAGFETNGGGDLEQLAALRREVEDVRDKVVGRLRRIEEDEFVGSFFC